MLYQHKAIVLQLFIVQRTASFINVKILILIVISQLAEQCCQC